MAKRRLAIAKTFATQLKQRAAASSWAKISAHGRAQVIYYIAENMIQRRDEIAARLARVVGEEQAAAEVDLSVQRIFSYGAWADKYEGSCASSSGTQHYDRHAGASWRHRHSGADTSAAAGAALADSSGNCGRQRCCCRAFGELPAHHRRSLPDARNQRCAERRCEPCRGQARRNLARRLPSTMASRPSGVSGATKKPTWCAQPLSAT